MPKKKDLILVGGGGHCRACIDVIEAEGRFKIAGIVDNSHKVNARILGYKVLGTDREWGQLLKKYKYFFITFGNVYSLRKRDFDFRKLKESGAEFPAVISPYAYVSSRAKVGEGTIVMHHAVVNAGAVIGNNIIINTKAIVEHDVTVGNGSHISTGSIINGGCRIGENVFIGSNTTLKEEVSICDNVIIGAGSVVLKPIAVPGTYAGNLFHQLPSRSQVSVLNTLSTSPKFKKVVVLAKSGKPTVDTVVGFLRDVFKECIVYEGHPGDAFPAEVIKDQPDILISYISPWIVPQKVLDRTRLWNINFHPGPPEYPGTGCFNFAIYNRERTYGATAHIMEAKVDTGKIIAVKRFPLEKSESVQELSLKTYRYMLELFAETMNYLIQHDKLPVCKEVWKRSPFTRAQLEELCRIDAQMTQMEVERRIQATIFPNKPGPYIEIEGRKFELSPKR